MEIQLIRHATMVIRIKDRQLLLDPMFSPPGTLSAILGVKNTADNPLTALPVEMSSLLDPSAVLLTHTHRDHFDAVAMESLPGTIPILCQPNDVDKLRAAGFSELLPVENSMAWQGITIHRTGGQHGTGEIGKSMGPVSGFIIEAEGEPRIYITGDTIWCTAVEKALEEYQPDLVVCFAGEARFSTGDPITMSKEDIVRICRLVPRARVAAVHMEAWNHCGLSRQELREYLKAESLEDSVYVPEDGEKIVI
ncbi:MAG: MBL fold metallo-hydrolase [Deltaproteobacteria bacterium]